MRQAVTLITILLLAAVAGADKPVKYELKQKYSPGDYVMTVTNDTDQLTQTETGMSVAQKMQMVLVSDMKVAKPGPEGQKVELIYRRIKQSITNGRMVMHFDSAGPPDQQNPVLAPMYNAMLNSPISFTVGPDGEISNLSGMDKMWDKVTAAAPAGPTQAIMAVMKEQFGDKMIEQMIGGAQMFLPVKAVAKGESWTVEQDQPLPPMMGQAKMTSECKLADVIETGEGKTAVIKFAGKLATDKPGAPVTIEHGQMTFNSMDIRQSGTMKMDLETGMVTETDVDQATNSVIEVTPSKGQGIPRKVSISQKSKVKTELRPGKYAPPTTKPTIKATTKPAEPTKDTNF